MISRVDREIGRDNLIEQVRQIAYGLHVYLGTGLLEKVYENGLKHRLEKAGFKVEAQKPLKVYDVDGFELGDYFADLFVNDELVVELKATKMIANEHLAQLLNYLKITNKPAGLLINFGSFKFESRVVHNNHLDNSHVDRENREKLDKPAAQEGSGDASPDIKNLHVLPISTANISSGSGVSPPKRY